MVYDYDVVIVGGGLVGGSLALALRDAPLRVAVVEAASITERLSLAAGDRALALARGTVQILDGLGVWPAVRPHAMPIRHIHVSDRGHFGKTRLHAADKGVDSLGQVVLARVLEEAIDRALETLPWTRFCPARVVGLQAGRDGICINLRQDRDDLPLTARLVVAADGGSSTVRRLLGIEQGVQDYGQTALVTAVRTDRDTAYTAYERFTAAGPLALLPLERHRSAVVWTLPHGEAAERLHQTEAEFIAQLQEVFGYWLGRLELAAPRQGFR